MSTNELAAQEGTAHLGRGFDRVGVDTTGVVHRHDPTNDRILLSRPDGPDATRSLHGRSVRDWALYVWHERGWDR